MVKLTEGGYIQDVAALIHSGVDDMRKVALAILASFGVFLTAAAPKTITFSFTQKIRTEFLTKTTHSTIPYLKIEELVITGKALLKDGSLVLQRVRLERFKRPLLSHDMPFLPSWTLFSRYIRHIATVSYSVWDSEEGASERKPLGWQTLHSLISGKADPRFTQSLLPLRPPSQKRRLVSLKIPSLGTMVWRLSFEREKENEWSVKLEDFSFTPSDDIKADVTSTFRGRLIYSKGLLLAARFVYFLRFKATSEGVTKEVFSQNGFRVERSR